MKEKASLGKSLQRSKVISNKFIKFVAKRISKRFYVKIHMYVCLNAIWKLSPDILTDTAYKQHTDHVGKLIS